MEEDNILTPMKAIRHKCLDCCCGNVRVVKTCPCVDCDLWLFRFGKKPNGAMKNSPLIDKKNFIGYENDSVVATLKRLQNI